MEMTGRVTADAKVTETNSGRKVTNFSIAINDRFKTKDGEIKQLTTYVSCAYWINPGVAPYLKKGILVQLYGRAGVNVWNSADGQAKGVLTLHVSNIKLFGKSSTAGNITEAVEPKENTEDLPF